jgi:hypothetical protein
MKKWIALLLVLTLLTGATGCKLFNPFAQSSEPPQSSEPEEDPTTLAKPEHAVIVLFDGLQTADVEKMCMAVNLDGYEISSDLYALAQHPVIVSAIRIVNKQLSYELRETVTDGDDATLTILAEYPDLSPVIQSAFEKYAPGIAAQILGGSFDAQAAYRTIALAIATELVKGGNPQTLQEEITVHAVRTEDKWRLTMDEALMDVCTANVFSALRALDLSALAPVIGAAVTP